MTTEAFLRHKGAASVLKLKAKREIMRGDAWRACVAFHEAAGLELRAADQLPTDDDALRNLTFVEACGLYLDARDPPAAMTAWQRIPSDFVTSDIGAPIVRRVQRALHDTHHRFSSEWKRFDVTLGTRSFEYVRLAPILRIKSLYPGIAGLWWAAYRYFERRQQWQAAGVELRHAIMLDPENRNYLAMDILLKSYLYSAAKALPMCAKAWARAEDSSAVNLTYALALLRLSRTKERRAVVLPDLDLATTNAVRLATSPGLTRQATLLRRYVDTLLVHPPTIEDFARLGVDTSLSRRRTQKSKVFAYEDSLIAACTPLPDIAA